MLAAEHLERALAHVSLEEGSNPERLRELASRDIDAATALLDAVLRAQPDNAALIEAVDAWSPEARTPALPYTLLIAPAAGYREAPEYGGDGRVAREVATRLGMPNEVIPLESLGSIRTNAGLIREALGGREERSVILVSISKGGAETRVALSEEGPWRRAVAGWLNVGGLLRGTPLVDYRAGNRVGYLVGRALMLLKGVPRVFLEDLGYESPLLRAQDGSPPGVPTVNLVGLPLGAHLQGRLASRHRTLARFGPNDGYVPTLDALIPGAPTYPLWGASHYFDTAELPRVLSGITAWLGAVVASRPNHPGSLPCDP